MIRRCTRLLSLLMVLALGANAQKCGFDQKHQQMAAANPAYAQAIAQMKNNLSAKAIARQNAHIVNTPGGIAYQVPVVIHVIHTGGAVGSNYNPTDAQLTGMVDYLNDVYAATWPGYPGVGAGGTDIPLRFAMAQRDPNCNPTNGINRIDGSGVAGYSANGVNADLFIGANDADVKALNYWPRDEYYNVWVVNKIDGEDGYNSMNAFIAGYAYLPGVLPAEVDGTVMLAFSAQAGASVLPHEIGHAFGLQHTFEGDMGGTTCPINNNCNTDGDGVCDTDPHIQTQFNCPTGINPCTGTAIDNVVHNIMDYSNCPDRFTPGQSQRIVDALMDFRPSLISSQGTLPPPTNAAATACVPTNVNGSNSGLFEVGVMDGSQVLLDVVSEGFSGDGNQALVDRTCKHAINLTAGDTYDFAAQTGQQPENLRGYIDYNNDGTFSATEEFWSSTGSSNNQIHTFSFTVPTTATVPDLVGCTPLRMRIASDRTLSPAVTACGPYQYGQAEDFTVIITGGGPTTGNVFATLTGGNPSCFNSSLTFTATPGAGITNPTYGWFVNGTFSGVTGTSWTSTTFQNNDVVTVKMYFAGACGADTSISTPITVLRALTVPPAVTINVTGGSNPGCAGQPITYTATPTNGGTAPTYQWKVNGTNQGNNSPTFTATLNNGDEVWVVMTSNSSCASPTVATSVKDTIVQGTFVANVTIAQIGSSIAVCPGTPLTFVATPSVNSGTEQFQWFVNGATLAGATDDTLVTTALINGDVLSLVYTVNSPCVSNTTDTSNYLTIATLPQDTPTVNVTITAGGNPGCLDSLVAFSANVTSLGNNPSNFWFVNGTFVSSGTAFGTTTLNNGDVVTFRSIATDGNCYTQDTVESSQTMALFSTPISPIISFIGNMLVSNLANNIIWYGPGVTVPDTMVGTGQNYQPTRQGVYYAVTDNQGCHSAKSNLLTISVLDIQGLNMSEINIYPNPTSGKLVMDWGTMQTRMKISVYSATGQGLLYDELNNGTRKELNMSHFANGIYFIVVRDEQGHTGTMRISVAK